MQNCLGIYIENNLIKYAKVSKDHDKIKVESFGIKFFDKLQPAIEQIIQETYSQKTPISVNMSEEIYNYFKEYGKKYYMDLGLPEEKLRFHDHEKLVFYAKAACDIEYLFPSIGWGEINGTHNRTNYDLSRHQEFSGIKQEYLDPETNEKFIPYIIESTYGLDRTVLAVLCQAYEEEEIAEVGWDIACGRCFFIQAIPLSETLRGTSYLWFSL